MPPISMDQITYDAYGNITKVEVGYDKDKAERYRWNTDNQDQKVTKVYTYDLIHYVYSIIGKYMKNVIDKDHREYSTLN